MIPASPGPVWHEPGVQWAWFDKEQQTPAHVVVPFECEACEQREAVALDAVMQVLADDGPRETEDCGMGECPDGGWHTQTVDGSVGRMAALVWVEAYEVVHAHSFAVSDFCRPPTPRPAAEAYTAIRLGVQTATTFRSIEGKRAA